MYRLRVVAEAPGSSPICLSGLYPQISAQIRNNLGVKSAIPDRGSLHNPCDLCQKVGIGGKKGVVAAIPIECMSTA
jgi:hypothetical protein